MAHRVLPLLLTAAVLVLALVSSAQAATVDVYGHVSDPAGEANAMTLTASGGRYVIRDRVPLTETHDGCTQPDRLTVVCPALREPSINLGAGDDRFTWAGDAPPEGAIEGGDRSTINGGPGNDVLVASPAADSVFGGLGADRLSGGEGDDTLDGRADGDRDRDVLDGGGGDDAIWGGDRDVAIGGAGMDMVEVGAGAELHTRDGVQEILRCTGRIGRIEADLRTATNVGNAQDQDILHGCFPGGRERAAVKLVTKRRRFRITRRTRVIRLTFACPATTELLCETTDLSDVSARTCQCGFSAWTFRILPGERLRVPFRISRSDRKSLLFDLGWKRRFKGAITWTSQLEPGEFAHGAVTITFVDGQRRKRRRR